MISTILHQSEASQGSCSSNQPQRFAILLISRPHLSARTRLHIAEEGHDLEQTSARTTSMKSSGSTEGFRIKPCTPKTPARPSQWGSPLLTMARPRGAAAGAAPHTVWDYTRKVQDPLERGAFLLKSGFGIGDLGIRFGVAQCLQGPVPECRVFTHLSFDIIWTSIYLNVLFAHYRPVSSNFKSCTTFRQPVPGSTPFRRLHAEAMLRWPQTKTALVAFIVGMSTSIPTLGTHLTVGPQHGIGYCLFRRPA